MLEDTEETTLPDASGNSIVAPRLEPVLVLHGGQRVETTPWRGLDAGR